MNHIRHGQYLYPAINELDEIGAVEREVILDGESFTLERQTREIPRERLRDGRHLFDREGLLLFGVFKQCGHGRIIRDAARRGHEK